MSEIYIKDDYVLSHYEKKIRFAGGKPVVVGYCRVSTEDQAEEGYSLETQRDKIREACSRKFPDGFHIFYIFEDESGKLPYDRGGMAKGTYRQGLTLATQLFDGGSAKYLAVYKLNRITRNARIYLELDEDHLRPNDVEIFSSTEQISNRTAASRFFTSIIAASAESERDNIVAVSRHGIAQRRNQMYFFGQVPFGWRWESAQGNRAPKKPEGRSTVGFDRPRQNIEPVSDEARVIKDAYAWYLGGKSTAWIAKELTRLSIRTRRGNASWSICTVTKLLENPIHAGFVRLDDDLVKGKHYPLRIVETKEFYAVLNRLKKQTQVSPATKRCTKHLFGEFAQCAICGKRLHIVPRKNAARYSCFGKSGNVRHASFSALVNRVEKGVTDCIARLASNPTLIDIAADRVNALVNDDEIRLVQEQESLTSQLEEKRRQITTWCQRFNDGQIDHEVFSLYNARLQQEISGMESRIIELRDAARQRECKSAQLEQAIGMLREFPRLWASMGIAEKRALASYVIESLTLEPDGNWVKVHLKLIVSEPETFRVAVRRYARGSDNGLDSLSRSELTLVYYYLQGYSDRQIAQERDIAIRTVFFQKHNLIKRVGMSTLEETLRVVAPLVEARKEELLIGKRGWGKSRDRYDLSPWQRQVVELVVEKLSVPEMAQRTGRTERAVREVISILHDRFGTHNRRDLVAAAQKVHLVSGPTIWSDCLTRKQADVISELAKGKNQREAAEALGITLFAVKERVKCMFRKFGLHSESALLEMAKEKGWIQL